MKHNSVFPYLPERCVNLHYSTSKCGEHIPSCQLLFLPWAYSSALSPLPSLLSTDTWMKISSHQQILSLAQHCRLGLSPTLHSHHYLFTGDQFQQLMEGCCQTEPVMHSCSMTERMLLHTGLGFKVLMLPLGAGRRGEDSVRTLKTSHVESCQSSKRTNSNWWVNEKLG